MIYRSDPHESGYYWIRRWDGSTDVVYYNRAADRVIGVGYSAKPDDLGVNWYGPLEPPKEKP